jgi:hypothetical protein
MPPFKLSRPMIAPRDTPRTQPPPFGERILVERDILVARAFLISPGRMEE